MYKDGVPLAHLEGLTYIKAGAEGLNDVVSINAAQWMKFSPRMKSREISPDV